MVKEGWQTAIELSDLDSEAVLEQACRCRPLSADPHLWPRLSCSPWLYAFLSSFPSRVG